MFYIPTPTVPGGRFLQAEGGSRPGRATAGSVIDACRQTLELDPHFIESTWARVGTREDDRIRNGANCRVVVVENERPLRDEPVGASKPVDEQVHLKKRSDCLSDFVTRALHLFLVEAAVILDAVERELSSSSLNWKSGSCRR